MGRFPEYKRQVSATALDSPSAVVANASIGQGIAALGQGISNLGAGVGTLIARREAEDDRAAREADALRVNVAKEQIARASQNRLDSVLRLRGQSAIDGSGQAIKDLQDEIKGIRESLSPRQQALLQPIELQQLMTFEHASNVHVGQETDQLKKSTNEAILTLQASNAAGAIVRGDMDSFEVAKAAGLGQIEQLSADSGDTPAVKQAREFEWVSSLHLASIESLLGAGNAGMAAQMLYEWDKTLDQTQVVKSNLRQRVEAAVTKQNAETIMMDAWRKSGGDVDTAEAAIAKDSTLDPKVRELAVVQVRKYGEAQLEALTAADKQVLATIGETIGRAQGRYKLEELLASEDMGRLRTQEMRTKAINMANAAIRARRSDASGQGDRDQVEWYDFLQRIEDDPDLADEGYDINGMHSNASPKLRAKIGAELARRRTGNEARNSLPPGEFSKTIDANIPADMEREKAETLRKAYLDMLQDYRTQNGGKNPPRKEVEAFFEKEKQKVNGSRKWLWGDDYTLQQQRLRDKVKEPPRLPGGGDGSELVRVRLSSGQVGRMPRNKVPKDATVLGQ